MEVQQSLDKIDNIGNSKKIELTSLETTENRKHKKMKFSDDCSGSDLSESEEIESLNVDSFATSKAGLLDSQATSKAGLSINSQNRFELQQLKVIVPDEFAPYDNSDCSADSSPRRHKPTAQNCAPVAPPLPKPVTPETCFYFPVVPYALQTMKNCLDKIVKNPDGTVLKNIYKGTKVTELEHEPDD